ncbi:MAG TPA: hypothetical protein VHT24_02195 [Pseudacidobacterium sp.]|jgi:hypothetical protein|nr:hypothetical protein [Pseudacidobacterium sp.]
MMVGTGYVTIDGTTYLSVNNPKPPTGGVQEIYTYDKYVVGTGWDHYQWNDYDNMTYPGGQ